MNRRRVATTFVVAQPTATVASVDCANCSPKSRFDVFVFDFFVWPAPLTCDTFADVRWRWPTASTRCEITARQTTTTTTATNWRRFVGNGAALRSLNNAHARDSTRRSTSGRCGERRFAHTPRQGARRAPLSHCATSCHSVVSSVDAAARFARARRRRRRASSNCGATNRLIERKHSSFVRRERAPHMSS